ncbi:MAG TPA: cell envelope integrity EipB family protein [Pseudolabrys sp.]|nr:cell envelope integrity EipB family protein [Pseudolabrys sp.]
MTFRKLPALVLLTALAIMTAGPRLAAAASPQADIVLVPHRAVYDLKLARTRGNRAIEAVRGRILYDFSGNSCEGYALEFRQVSELDSGEGKNALSDLRSTTWEDGQAKKFRFTSTNSVDEKNADQVNGHAERKAKAVAVSLTRPKDKNFTIPLGAVFPTEHIRRIITAAREGKSVLEFPVYDGSETGDKIFNTLTVIGKPILPGENVPDDAAGKAPELAKLTRWPVTISYFDQENDKQQRGGEQIPGYTIGFELYENGVSRALKLDYTDFTISGEMTSLEIKDAKPCP